MIQGINCKVWNIDGTTATKHESAQLKDSITYILEEEKTEIKADMPGRTISDPAGQLGRECRYIEDDVKTMDGVMVGTRNLFSCNVKEAVEEMMEVKEFYGKEDGRAAQHGVISLDELESDVRNAPALMGLCEEVLAEVFPDNQAIFAVHTNTDNLHIHFIVNTVGLDGKKIHEDKDFMKEVLHTCVNKYAEKYGFTKNKKWEEEIHSKYAQHKINLRERIDRAIEKSDSFEEFIGHLEKEKITVNVGKHISLRTPDMVKAIRTHRLGPNYTKDAIVERIKTRKDALKGIRATSHMPEIKKEVVYDPEVYAMKKYKSMAPEEKADVLKQLRQGRNPWRIHNRLSWQLNDIANTMNRDARVQEYVKVYSEEGTLQGALDGILRVKKIIAEDKRRLREHIRHYKPIIDIYKEMKEIERKAYLYEHENIPEYRKEFETYRELTRRLRDGYDKDVDEVASFVKECDNWFEYSNGQLMELSTQYREIKMYARERGMDISENASLPDLIGLFDSREEAKQGVFEADAFYLVSADSEVILRVIKTPSVDERGRTVETAEVTVMDCYGRVLEQCDSSQGLREFDQFLQEAEKKYGFTECQKYKSASSAREFAKTVSDIRQDKTKEEKQEFHGSETMQEKTDLNKEENQKPKTKQDKADYYRDRKYDRKTTDKEKTGKPRKSYSFTKALNLGTVKNEREIHVIINAENPSFMAVVRSNDQGLIVQVMNSAGKKETEVSLPPVHVRSADGYKKIMALQKDFGFSDKMYSFRNVEDAKKYKESVEANRQTEDREAGQESDREAENSRKGQGSIKR